MILASNRLPVRLTRRDGAVELVPASGGLANAVREVRGGARWVGWLGEEASASEVASVLDEHGFIAVELSEPERIGYYEQFSNGVLWPLLHCNIDKLPLSLAESFAVFRAVNQRFARECLRAVKDDEPIWLHDFHLFLVPSEIRRQAPGAHVGFFLHVPFPPVEVFRVLPQARELIAGVLGADVVGFHTRSYADALIENARVLLGARVDGDVIDYAGHSTRVLVAPISIDVGKVRRAATTAHVEERVRALKDGAHGRKILLGVDRLDYTKGIRRRFLALERLLQRWPELAPHIHFVQVAVPTRENVDAYADHRGAVNELVTRINGKHGSPMGMPIHFIHREIPFDELVALYAAADVMVVTPTRDGMNLVCKEFVAAREDERGVLILSEFAGAVDELAGGALVVNPFDIDALAVRMRQALLMTEDEQTARMAGMRSSLVENDVHRWARTFMSLVRAQRVVDGSLEDALACAARAPRLHVLLDYDGTLVPLETTPSQAEADDEVRALLTTLSELPNTTVHVVSGRDARFLAKQLGDLPVWLHAEHGAQRRPPGETFAALDAPSWRREALEALSIVAAQTKGALVEEKRVGVALHLRAVPDKERLAPTRAAVRLLEKLQARCPDIKVLVGNCVVEARRAEASKATVLDAISLGADDAVIAAGDDATDDGLFAALPRDAVTIGVGAATLIGRFRVHDARELRHVLSRLAGWRR